MTRNADSNRFATLNFERDIAAPVSALPAPNPSRYPASIFAASENSCTVTTSRLRCCLSDEASLVESGPEKSAITRAARWPSSRRRRASLP